MSTARGSVGRSTRARAATTCSPPSAMKLAMSSVTTTTMNRMNSRRPIFLGKLSAPNKMGNQQIDVTSADAGCAAAKGDSRQLRGEVESWRCRSPGRRGLGGVWLRGDHGQALGSVGLRARFFSQKLQRIVADPKTDFDRRQGRGRSAFEARPGVRTVSGLGSGLVISFWLTFSRVRFRGQTVFGHWVRAAAW